MDQDVAKSRHPFQIGKELIGNEALCVQYPEDVGVAFRLGIILGRNDMVALAVKTFLLTKAALPHEPLLQIALLNFPQVGRVEITTQDTGLEIDPPSFILFQNPSFTDNLILESKRRVVENDEIEFCPPEKPGQLFHKDKPIPENVQATVEINRNVDIAQRAGIIPSTGAKEVGELDHGSMSKKIPKGSDFFCRVRVQFLLLLLMDQPGPLRGTGTF
jgi:hypothetical protein